MTSPDSTEVQLLVGVKLGSRALASNDAQIKESMLSLVCPVGLIVTPEKMRLYADRFVSNDATSIERVGEFDTRDLLRYKGLDEDPSMEQEHRFENAVQTRLIGLPTTATRQGVKDEQLWGALRRYVIPALETGDVRAAAPRA